MTIEEKLVQALNHAKEAGLRYVYDSDPGFGRKRHGKGFSYIDSEYELVRDKKVIARFVKLAIPPAWEKVWICASANGHIQATGLDARGRKQYRYHEKWRAVRDENKFSNMLVFGRALPAIRRKVQACLNLEGLPRDKVIAAAVRLLDKTGLRVGNDAYTDENDTFGITTIRKKHLDLNGSVIELDFPGKGGKQWQGAVTDAKLAKVMAQISDLPGVRLFKYKDDKGDTHAIGSADINEWMQNVSGEAITAKDFRTWNACTLFLAEAMEQTSCSEAAQLHLKPVLKSVSAKLGNTPAILQKSYVHPELVDLYRTGCFINKEWQHDDSAPIPAQLRRTEALLLRWLEKRYG